MLSALSSRQDYIPPDLSETGIGGRVVTSSMWSGISVVAMTLLQFVRSMIFARLLMPADFGIVALANVFTQFILIFANFGFNSSVIYRRDLNREDLATCWWGNLFIDGLAATVCVGIAFFTRRFADTPQIPWVIMMLAIQFLLVSFGSINVSLLRRSFMFKQTAMIDLTGAVISFAAGWFCVAVLGWGVYGLVAGLILGSLGMSLLSFGLMPWLPSLAFSWAALKKHANYGRWFLGVNVVSYTNNNIDRGMIGTLLSKTQLGYYEYAFSIPIQSVGQLAQIISGVLFPAFSSLQKNLPELRRVILNVMRYSTLITYPLLVGLGLVADDFVILAYGEKWRPVIAPMRAFCFYGLVQIAWAGLSPLCYGLGKPHLAFKWYLIGLPINVLAIYIAAHYFGVLGVALAKLVLGLFLLATLRTEIMNHVGLPLVRQLAALWPALSCSLVMSLPLGLLQGFGLLVSQPLAVRLLIQIPLGAITYLGALYLFWRSDFAYFLALPARLAKPATKQ